MQVIFTWEHDNKHHSQLIPRGAIAWGTYQAHSHLSEDVIWFLECVLLDSKSSGSKGIDSKHGGEIPGLKLCSLSLNISEVGLHLLATLHNMRGHQLQFAGGENS